MARGTTSAPSRRTFLTRSASVAACGVAALSPLRGWASAPTRQLAMHQMQTGETIDVVYAKDGQYLTDGCAEIDYLMRDWHTGEVVVIDRQLLDLVYVLNRRLAPGKPFEVLCGYRSRETNEQLRRTQRGVAKNSYHIPGMAIDLRLPDVPLKTLRDEAIKLEAGGVGYYPHSGFVHVDTGTVRHW